MTGSSVNPGPGSNVAFLRKARGMSQSKLAREAGVSLSLLSKIEVGDRALNQGVAAALARAMGITLDEVLGKVTVSGQGSKKLQELRSAIRRFDLPGDSLDDADGVRREFSELVTLRGNADLHGVLEKLPEILGRATNLAHMVGSPASWSTVADIYSSVYWVAARHRWMDLAELAVMKQKLAAERANPLAVAIAARDEAGTFLNSGDFGGGLAVVERAIGQAESALKGRERALGLGILHLRGLTLAGRLKDTGQFESHADAAWQAASDFGEDVDVNGITFGPDNTATHLVASYADMEKHRDALEIAEKVNRRISALPATRVGPHHLNSARVKLALKDRDGSLESLVSAWRVAPQMTKVHPTGQELIRVLVSLHQRSNPTLTQVARLSGISV